MRACVLASKYAGGRCAHNFLTLPNADAHNLRRTSATNVVELVLRYGIESL